VANEFEKKLKNYDKKPFLVCAGLRRTRLGRCFIRPTGSSESSAKHKSI